MKTADWLLHLDRLAGNTAMGPVSAGFDSSPPDPTLLAGPRGEQILWRAALGDPSADPVPVLAHQRGPILPTDAFLAIEVWAECELASLHALHRLARKAPRDAGHAMRERLAEAVAWHLENTQPDNSTNRPWAIHVFVLDAARNPESGLYAETLLSNMLATDARNEVLSRWILADAAAELRVAHGER